MTSAESHLDNLAMNRIGKGIIFVGFCFFFLAVLLFFNYFAIGYSLLIRDAEILNGPAIPFFLLLAGVPLIFTALMLSKSELNKK